MEQSEPNEVEMQLPKSHGKPRSSITSVGIDACPLESLTQARGR